MPSLVNLELVLNAARQISSAEWFSTLAAGAFFGAWGAQVIISRSQLRQSIVTELNTVNSALALCFAIYNRFIALKKQHIKSLHDKYKEARKAYFRQRYRLKFVVTPAPPVKSVVYEFEADLNSFATVHVPTSVLERYIFEMISIRGRAPAVTVELIVAIDGLNKSIDVRNSPAADIQRASLPSKELAERYFGIPTSPCRAQSSVTRATAPAIGRPARPATVRHLAGCGPTA